MQHREKEKMEEHCEKEQMRRTDVTMDKNENERGGRWEKYGMRETEKKKVRIEQRKVKQKSIKDVK